MSPFTSDKPARILYLTRNGLLEPLGQSQIIPYLRGLSVDTYITLITFEKPADLAQVFSFRSMRKQCAQHAIRWIRLKFFAHPRPWAPLVAVPQLALFALFQWFNRTPPSLVHARSYVPAGIALFIHRITGVPFLFDMRALWPEELITSGRLQRGSFLHRFLIWLECRCLQEASAVVSLTHASVGYLREKYPQQIRNQRISVIPTCVDVHRFGFVEPEPNRPLVIGCIGTVLSGWFLLDWLRSFFEAVLRVDPNIYFDIVTRDCSQTVLSRLGPSRFLSDRLHIRSAHPSEMPSIIQRHSASVMFYDGSATSELGRSPTRMAEVLSCGRPVVANSGVGDVEYVLRRYGVGVLATGPTATEMDQCVVELLSMLKDPDHPIRCRLTAEKLFSLDAGTAAYRDLYAQILG